MEKQYRVKTRILSNFEYGDILTSYEHDGDLYENEKGYLIGKEEVEECPVLFERVYTSVDRLIEMARADEYLNIFGDEYIITDLERDYHDTLEIRLQLKR